MHFLPWQCYFKKVICILQGMSSVFFNKGENCIAAGRLFVEESIHDEYLEKIVSKTGICCSLHGCVPEQLITLLMK